MAKSKPVGISFGRKKFSRERATNLDTDVGEGLGSLPRHLPSVSSLLLFNTAENPYKKYVLLDPLEGAKTKTREVIQEEKISDAPLSITQGEELGRGQQEDFQYVPVLGELSELEVPDTLALPFVASDVFYSGDVGQSIAPSLANVPELPNLADPAAPAATDTPSLPPPSGSEPPPPPPAAPAPPPPPAPPVAAPPLPSVGDQSGDSSDEGEGETGGGQPPADSGDGRASLMEAIRKAGECEGKSCNYRIIVLESLEH